jgi:hypothetical protein
MTFSQMICPRTVHYRLYRETGEIPCKKPVDPSDPGLSRMNVNFLTPPHTPNTVKRCLCFAEQISDRETSKLFLDISGESELNDSTQALILFGAGPGFSLDNPMALVHSPTSQPAATTNPMTCRLRAKYKKSLSPSDHCI